MKAVLPILVGSVLGSTIYVTATYALIPQDSGSYLSYMDTVFVTAAISLAAAAIFFAFFVSFRVKSRNTALLLTTALGAQLLSWLTTLVFPQLGLLTFVVATSVFSAIANFILSRLSS